MRVDPLVPVPLGLILPPPCASHEYIEKRAAPVPLKRHGVPERITRAVVFLAQSGLMTQRGRRRRRRPTSPRMDKMTIRDLFLRSAIRAPHSARREKQDSALGRFTHPTSPASKLLALIDRAQALTGAHRSSRAPSRASCVSPTAASVFDLHRRALTSPRPNGCRANRAFHSPTSALRRVVAPSARSIDACASTAGVSASALHLVAVLSAPDPIPRPGPGPRAVRPLGDRRNPTRLLGGAHRLRERRRRSSSAPRRS